MVQKTKPTGKTQKRESMGFPQPTAVVVVAAAPRSPSLTEVLLLQLVLLLPVR